MIGGRVRDVRLKITLPAGELKLAVVEVVNVSVPSW
jgi:hypothetical protein